MPGRFVLLLAAFGTASLALGGCSCGNPTLDIPDAQVMPDGGSGDSGGPGFSDSAISRTDLSLERVVPSHGPFLGGNRVILRGSGFTGEANVFFGEHAVQGADHELIDGRRLAVIVPAGEPGVVDVRVEVDGEEATLADGYTYDSIAVDPDRGATSGGTFVTITAAGGLTFEEGDTPIFGRTACTGIALLTPTRITCRVPPSSAGYVDVIVRRGEDDLATAVDAYQYYDTSDPINGGLGGGPVMGSINLTAIDAMTGAPVEAAFGILGEDLTTEHQGLTDALGQLTFSGSDLVGTHTIHVVKHCYERTSVVSFDASDVTVFLIPLMDPACGMGMGNPPIGRGRNAAFIEGRLVWSHDMTGMTWDNVPAPRTGWVRVAYVYTTVSDIGYPNPDPSLGGAHPRVLETEGDGLGYPYRILARPAGLAVYALAGVEETATGRFVPYVMGVARNVLAGPGETVPGVDILMDIPLDHTLGVQTGALPPPARTGPDRFRVEAYMDLGGEGLIQRVINDEEFDVVRRRHATEPFRFVGGPALEGALSDGRYRVIAGWFTSEFDGQPYTVVVQNGVTQVDDVVVMPDFLGIPEATSPAFGERIPADRVLRWTEEGEVVPDLHVILMLGGDFMPAWRMFVRGDVFEAPMPDLSTIEGLEDVTPGDVTWVVYAVKIPGFDFDTFSYAHLNDRYWSHYSYDYFTAQL